MMQTALHRRAGCRPVHGVQGAAPRMKCARGVHVHAASDAQSRGETDSLAASSPASPESSGASPNPYLPKIGYFAISDPKAEVYSRAGEAFDPTKKGGRWKPEFIWNTNWQEALKREEDLRRQQEEYRKRVAEEGGTPQATGAGVVRFGMRSLLDDPNVDLSAQLRGASERAAAAAAAPTPSTSGAGARDASAPASSSGRAAAAPKGAAPGVVRSARARGAGSSPSFAFKDLPTRAEARRFQSTTRAAMRTAPTTTLAFVGQLPPEEAAELERIKAVERAAYERLKQEFQLWALGLSALGLVSAYEVYGSDTAVSYAIGSAAGMLYLRLLGRSVDAVGAEARAGAGTPRLLIPVILALGYNRFNVLYAAQAGFALQLPPMLLGFFTYKFAVVGRQGLQLLNDLSADVAGRRRGGEGEGAGEADGGGGGDDGGAMTLDRIFVKRVIQG